MDIVNSFKNHLLSQKKPPSKVTVKNYVSDVRRFINWYVTRNATPFNSQQLSPHILTAYQTEIMGDAKDSLPAARSAKRYISSLRRFGQFLADSGAIEANPFAITETPKPPADPWFMKDFQNFLYTERASKLTIKNYIIDIKQFLDWLEKVTHEETEHATTEILQHISAYALESYKMRLLHEAQLSPVSINRKLSSIRRYIRWLEEKGIIDKFLDVQAVKPPQNAPITEGIPEVRAIIEPLPLTALQGLAEEVKKKQETTYSSFAPLRLLQKTAKLVTLGTDAVFFNPLAASVEVFQYKILKKEGKKVFAPVKTILETASYIPEAVSIKTIIPKATSIMPPMVAKPAAVAMTVKEKLLDFGMSAKPSGGVKNFAKELYAPLQISTKHMHWKQKLFYHLRYTRPAWYRIYHNYRFVNYLHYAILIIGMVIAGANLYHIWFDSSQKQTQAVLSSQATSPPRTIAFKGRLLDSTNTPITAETPLRFAIYNSPTASGAARLWEEKQHIKPDRNGNFTAQLGKISRLNQSVFADNASLYVGISINDNAELKPRQQLPSTTFAANAQAVSGLTPITDSPDKTSNVLLALDSSGNLTIGGSANPIFQATGGQFTLSGQTLMLTTGLGSNGTITLSPDGDGFVDIQKPIQNTSYYNNPSGIKGAVEVDDLLSVYTSTSSQSALTVGQNGTGDIISGNSNGVAKFKVDAAGNTFIGGSIDMHGSTIGTTATNFGIANDNVTTLTLANHATALSLGSNSGVTSINNNLLVHGTTTLSGAVSTNSLLTANGGIMIGQGQRLTLAGFNPGAIAFIDESGRISQNVTHFGWLENQQTLKIVGSLCVRATDGACGSNPGTIYASNATVQAADLAENYVSTEKLEPGDVVVPEGKNNNAAVIKSSQPYQKQVIGIISTKPGFTLNSDATADPNHPTVYPLALQGRVPVKISSMNGPVQAGDDLTSSSIPGVAMKATGSGKTIGKALEAYNASDPNAVGKIMAFVNLSYHANDDPTTLTDQGNLDIAKQSGTIAFDPMANLTADVVKATKVITGSISINGTSLDDYITSVVKKIQTAQSQTPDVLANNTLGSQNVNPVATTEASPKVTPSLSVDTVASTSGSFASSSAFPIYNSIDASDLTASVSGVASASALIASPSATPTPSIHSGSAPQTASNAATQTDASTPTASGSALRGLQHDITTLFNSVSQLANQSFANSSDLGLESLDVKAATVSGTLSVFGRTTLGDVGVTGKVNVGLMTIDGLNADGFATINTSTGPLKFQSDGLNGVDFLNGKVAIDPNGNLKVNGNALFAKDVTVKGKLAANIIAPIPGSDLAVQNDQGENVININQHGDIAASGAGQFGGLKIVRSVDADASVTQTISQNSAGKGTIKANQTSRTIFTPYVTDHSLIYVTATSNTQSVTPYLARQAVTNPQTGTKASFTIQIPHAIKQDISFNWWIVN